MSIVWKDMIIRGDDSKEDTFEELCCQIARQENIENEENFFRIKAPDAGVECYLKLADGKEIGWQAKFFTSPPKEVQFSQIDESVKTALEKHSDLSKYIVCLPINREDPRIEDQEWFMDRWNRRVQKWEKWASAKGMSVQFVYWGESEIEHRLIQYPKLNYRFFGIGEPDVECIKNYLGKVIERADEMPKYLVEAKSNSGRTNLFTHIRQKVAVSEYKEFEKQKENEIRTQAKRRNSGQEERTIEKIEWSEDNVTNFERVIIWGKPGSGKSWLLKYEAKRLAEKGLIKLQDKPTSLEQIILPVWVYLPDWAKRCRETDFPISALVNLIIEQYTDIRADDKDEFEILQSWLTKKIRSENCVILLDALDEIPSEIDFTEKLRIFSSNEARSSKIYLTSRQAEYRKLPFAGNYKKREVQLLDFEPEQVKQFYCAWFGKYSQKSERFEEILEDNPSLEGLARTPLLLSLLCALFDKHEDPDNFPTKRAEIYEQCIDKIFLKEWKDAVKDGDLDGNKIKEMLAFVGYRLFCETGEPFTARDLEEKITEWLKRENFSLQLDSTRKIIRQLKEDGLIASALENERKPEENQYVFLHRTFLEYFAACGLARLEGKASSRSWEEIVYENDILYDPNWAEVLQLFGGKLNKTDSKKYIKTLLKINGENGERDIFFRPLKLAVNAAIEAEKLLDKSFFYTLLRKAGEKWINSPDYNDKIIFFSYYNLYISRMLKSEIEPLFLDPNIDEVVYALLAHNTSPSDRIAVAHILGTSKANINKKNIAVLRFAAINDPDPEVRCAAVKSLGKIGKKHENELYFEKIGKITSSRIAADILTTALKDSQTSVRNAAIHALGEMRERAIHPFVLDTLTEMLRDPETQKSTIEALGKMGKNAITDNILDVLSNLLKVKDHERRNSVFALLAEVEEKAITPIVLDSLAEALKDVATQRFAINTLKKTGKKAATENILRSLIELLKDSDKDLSVSVVEVLGKMGEVAVTEDFLDLLIKTLKDSNNLEVYRIVTTSLGHLGKGKLIESVLDSLVEDFEKSSKSSDRSSAVEALGVIGEIAVIDTTIETLAKALSDPNKIIYRAAIKAVENIGEKAAREIIVTALFKISGNENASDRISAVVALEELGIKVVDDSFLVFLSQALQDPDEHIRLSAAEALDKLGEKAATENIIASLINALTDDSEIVWVNAAEALASIGEKAATKQVLNSLVLLLKNTQSLFRFSIILSIERLTEIAPSDLAIEILREILEIESLNVIEKSTAKDALLRIAMRERIPIPMRKKSIWRRLKSFLEKLHPNYLYAPRSLSR